MNGYRYAANLIKALAHPTRMQILEVIYTEGESCVCHLEARLGQRQSYISQQLAKLREAGLVVDRREGLNVYYGVVHNELEDLIGVIKQFIKSKAHAEGLQITFDPILTDSPEECDCPKCEEKLREGSDDKSGKIKLI
jgi:ArsR family transcriptional regulator